MELTLKRRLSYDDRTIGTLSIDGKYFCDTLEDTERLFWSLSNFLGKLVGIKVQDKTAIPRGKYRVIMAYSNRFKKRLPLLLDVPQFTGILMHSGNTVFDTSGCLLCGTIDPKTNNIKAGTSTPAITKLVALIEEATKKGKVYITIN